LAERPLRRFFRHRLGVLGFCLVCLMIACAVGATSLMPRDPMNPDLYNSLAAPSSEHVLGTDSIGRDVFSRLILGSRVSLEVGVLAVALYVIIGIIVGSLAGYYGKTVDAILMRTADIVLSFPQLVVILTLVAIVGPGLRNMVLVIGFLGWPKIARIVRSQFLSLREREFVLLARSAGATDARVMVTHILPNCANAIVVNATFGVAAAILMEASLSFLGMGVQPPTPSWGNMLMDAQSLTVLERMPWLWVPPGLLISLSVLSINFIGDALRDALDPKTIIR